MSKHTNKGLRDTRSSKDPKLDDLSIDKRSGRGLDPNLDFVANGTRTEVPVNNSSAAYERDDMTLETPVGYGNTLDQLPENQQADMSNAQALMAGGGSIRDRLHPVASSDNIPALVEGTSAEELAAFDTDSLQQDSSLPHEEVDFTPAVGVKAPDTKMRRSNEMPPQQVQSDMAGLDTGDHRPVPRISINVFCETDGIRALMSRAADDRRMLKTHMELIMGGIKKAIDFYKSNPTPNLIVLEVRDGSRNLIDGLEELAQLCDPSTKVVIIGAVNDIRLYRELISRGVSEYLVAPRVPSQIINSIAELYVDPSAKPIGKSYVFVGARGGVGSSTLSHNVAWTVAEQLKSDTVLLDLDLAFGTAGMDFDRQPSQGLLEALESPGRLDDVLLERLQQKHSDRLNILTAPNRFDRNYDIPLENFESVIDIVRTTAPSVIVDLPNLWSAWSEYVLRTADVIIITAVPDLASFRNTKNLVEIVQERRANDAPPFVVLNQTDVPKRPEVPAAQFEETLGFPLLANIAWDPNIFGTAATNGNMLQETNPKAKVVDSINMISNTILGREPAHHAGGSSFFKSLFSK